MRIRDALLLILLVFVFVFFPLVAVYGDFLWFSSVGYSSVFLTSFFTKLMLGIVAAAVMFVVLYLNLFFAKKGVGKRKGKRKRPAGKSVALLAVVSLLVGAAFSSGWETLLKYASAVPFGAADPVFGADISFYTFVLPFYTYILGFALAAVILSLLLLAIRHVAAQPPAGEEEPDFKKEKKPPQKVSKPHLSLLAGTLFVLIAIFLFLERFNVLFSARGAVFGAGFTDLSVQLPLLSVLAAAAAVVAVLFLAGTKSKSKSWKLQKLGVAAFFAVIVVTAAALFVTQQFVVSPDEFNRERDYIQRNIDFTTRAYGLDKVDERPFPVSLELSPKDLENNRVTLDNIRLWDFRPLKKTYSQLQLFRTYYDFRDIDIDRYLLDGELKQVTLSARELNQRSLDPKADTWVNRHLVFTHGYGLAANPVEQVSEEGLPVFLVKDIPPQSPAVKIERPEIYYGERTDNFVVVRTTTDELDYPSGSKNVYTTYEGTGGVALPGLSRLVYAIKFGSVELLVSGSIGPESKLLFNRNIAERTGTIAPFLKYDPDPYIVAADGRLFWILDAYTTTDRYPYSEPFSSSFRKFNYIRNSVKVTVDAYNGDTTFYVIDESDPVVSTYREIFPDLFRDFSEMPDTLKAHIRYPEGLFRVQSELYSVYHMKDPRVFYNKEDVWNAPQEIYRGTKQELIPYYVIMKLPQEDKEEFILMLPFTPRNKDNMIGWMAARSDGEHYGELIVFTFSKQELLFGPLQVEARIDQDTEISQLITLWSQSGSDVIRGNLLVIPIEDSILYIEPVYLEASGTGALPEFKRVIVAFGDRLTMKETLGEALDELFAPVDSEPAAKTAKAEKTQEQLITEAGALYQRAQELLRSGDLAGYAAEIEKLGDVLQRLGA